MVWWCGGESLPYLDCMASECCRGQSRRRIVTKATFSWSRHSISLHASYRQVLFCHSFPQIFSQASDDSWSAIPGWDTSCSTPLLSLSIQGAHESNHDVVQCTNCAVIGTSKPLYWAVLADGLATGPIELPETHSVPPLVETTVAWSAIAIMHWKFLKAVTFSSWTLASSQVVLREVVQKKFLHCFACYLFALKTRLSPTSLFLSHKISAYTRQRWLMILSRRLYNTVYSAKQRWSLTVPCWVTRECSS